MKRVVAGLRALAVAGLGVAVVVGAGQYAGTVTLRDPQEPPPVAGVATVPLTERTVLCPGPQTLGLTNAQAVTGRTVVQAASPPLAALPESVRSALAAATPAAGAPAGPGATPTAGALTLTALGGASLGAAPARAAVVAAGLDGPVAATVHASGPQAPGAGALQTWLRSDGDSRALIATTCLRPSAQLWLLGGGGQPSRRERLVLVNPGAGPVRVVIDIYGAKGRIVLPYDTSVTVPPASRASVLLDALAPGEVAPAVRLTASGGEIGAVLDDAWIDGATARGAADSVAAATPDTALVIGGLDVAGAATLRLLAPGDEATATVRLLTAHGPIDPPGGPLVKVPAGGTKDVDLTGIPAGGYAITVASDKPVTGAVYLERRSAAGEGVSDFGWVPATPPIGQLAGVPVPAGTTGYLTLSAQAPGTALVRTVAASGAVTDTTITFPGPGTSSLPLTGPLASATSVWVSPTQQAAGGKSMGLRAALALTVADPGGPLFAVAPLVADPLTVPLPTLRERRP